MDGGAWQAAVHGVSKSRTRLSYFTSTFHFHALEKEMATHSSVLAWRIPGTGEPGGLPSMGSHSRTRLKRLSSSSSSRWTQIVLCQMKCQTENDKYYMILLVCGIQKVKQLNEHSKTDTESQIHRTNRWLPEEQHKGKEKQVMEIKKY